MRDGENISFRLRTTPRRGLPFHRGLPLHLAVLFFLGGPAAFAQTPLPAVGVAPVEVKDVSPASEFVGRVEAVNAVDIRARVEGFIAARPFKEGQAVREGDDLFILEKASYEAALAAARANLRGAQATLEDAERRVQRNQDLRRSQTVSQVTLEEAQTARDTAQASVLAAEANVRQAELNVGYTTIKTPIAGRIGVAAFSVGSLVGPSSGALARVVQIDPIRVVFSVNDRTILALRESVTDFDESKVARSFVPTLRLSNGRDYPIKGAIEFVGNEIDQATGTLPVRARFANPDGVLVPGQFVTIVVRPLDPQTRPVVPVGAVQLDREGRFVLLLDENGKVAQRRIKTGAQLGQNWVVEDGLKGGESVIVQGFQNARPGAAVRVVPAAAGADSQ
jgi:membrane fusion protein (multidrug efflux system)